MNYNQYYDECRAAWEEEGNKSSTEYNDYLTNVVVTNLEGDAINDMIDAYNENIPNMKSLTPEYSVIEVEGHPELEEISERVCSDISSVLENHMGCHMRLMQIKLKRHKNVERVTLPAFRWHSDLHEDPLLNVMVYISKVDEGSGPFQYLLNGNDRGIVIDNITHDFPDDYIEHIIETFGLKVTSLLGEPGTMCIFNNNIVHRGSIPTEQDRDVLLFQFRPVKKKPEKHLDWDYLNSSWDELMQWDKWDG